MSQSTHIKNMLKTPSDLQILSVRLPVTTVNQLDELVQTVGITRSELISTFIQGGLEELEKQIADEMLIADELLEEEILRDESSTTDRRYFLLNTNFNNSQEDHYTMMQNKEASAFYGNWKKKITHLNNNDVVFLYQSGIGIVAYGYADGQLIKRDHNGKVNEWYTQKLNDFSALEKPLTAKACKDVTGSKLDFRKVMVALTEKQGMSLLNEFGENKI